MLRKCLWTSACVLISDECLTRQDCACEDGCDRCSVEFTLDAVCTSDRGAMFVTSKDLVRSNTMANPYSEEAAYGPVAPRHPDFGKPVGQGTRRHRAQTHTQTMRARRA